ncbi:MAG: acyl-CoA dehydrogenase family protein [Actinomycetota bacterium]
MDFDLTEEQEGFRGAVREFANDVLAPRAGELDHGDRFPLDIVQRMGELGLFGLPFPARYGGLDSDFLTFCLCLEEVARVDSSVAMLLESAVVLGAGPIFRFGTEEQKERWLVPMARGRILGFLGLAEPGGGSDAGSIRTTARLEGDEWVIDGSKTFVANSGTPISGLCTVAAVTGEQEISAILLPVGTSGFSVGPPDRRAGWLAGDPRDLVLSGCRVPRGNLLGERGRGYAQLLQPLDDGRIAIAALSAGLARGLEEKVTAAMEHGPPGLPVGRESLGPEMADVRTAMQETRFGYLRAAWLKDHGRPYESQAAVAKLLASQLQHLLIAGDLGLTDAEPPFDLKSPEPGDEEDG